MDQGLATQEDRPLGTMYFLLEGTLEVIKDGLIVASILPDHLVREMSIMTGDPASADTRPAGKVRVHESSQQEIRELKDDSPELYNSLLAVLGRDLSSKLDLTDTRRAPDGIVED